jgi:ketosteroid isomerase-like protein
MGDGATSKVAANAALIREYLAHVQSLEHDDGSHDQRNFYAPDIRVEWTGRSPIAGSFAGREVYEQWLPKWAPYDVRILEIVDVLASETRAAVVVVEEYRDKATGEVLVLDRIALYEIEDGLITSMTVRDTDQYASDDFWTRTQP